MLTLKSEPDVRTQVGTSNALGKSNNNGQKPDAVLLAAAQVKEEDISVSKQQWIHAEPIKGIPMMSMLATPDGELYVLGDQLSFYKLPCR